MSWREKIWASDNEFCPYALIEYIDPDWKDHFFTPYSAIDFYAEFMGQDKFMKAVKESQ